MMPDPGKEGLTQGPTTRSARDPSERLRNRAVLVASLFGLIGLGCSGDVDDGNSDPPFTQGSDAVPMGSQPPAGQGPEVPGVPGQDPTVSNPTGQNPAVPGTNGVDPAVPGTNGVTPDMPGVVPGPVDVVDEDPNAIPAVAPASVIVPTPRLARLSRSQWSNTVRQLLKVDDIADIDADVSGDALLGFDSEADKLYVTEQLRADFATAAERLADRVTGDAAALGALLPPDAPTDLAGRASAFVTTFGMRAFRRPLSEAEVTSHLSLFDQGPELYPGVDAFAAGANLVIQAMLQSPHFLYRTELESAAPGSTEVALNDYEVASKLAFALTNTMPDDDLLAVAASGALQDRANVVAQARTLMESESGADGIANFNFQTFRLGTYDGIVRNAEDFPSFTPETPAAMRAEVQHFFEWIFQEGLGVRDYYSSPVGFVNSTLAALYGLEETYPEDTFTKVDLDPTQRSGFLTQAGFLASYASGMDPDIIHRGVFIATRLLCVTLPPPAPNAGQLVEIQPDMTNRDRVEATTGRGTCGEGCHSALLNPLGYAFENYDTLGQYRTMDHRGLPIDASDNYSLDGAVKPFSNGVELSQLLAESKTIHDCYAGNLMGYLHGRLLATEDEPIVDYYARLSRAGMLSVQDLELDMVTSDSFLKRLP